MLLEFQSAIRMISAQVEREANLLGQRLHKTVADEDDFTSRFADRIERNVDGTLIDGVQFNVETRKFTSSGRGSEESRLGADIALVVSANGPQISISKGYLIQAKIAPHGFPHSLTQRQLFPQNDRIHQQCKKMLGITPESYLWLYHEDGIDVVRAATFQGAKGLAQARLLYRSIGHFFFTCLSCWNGDHRIGSTSVSFDQLGEEYGVKQALAVKMNYVLDDF